MRNSKQVAQLSQRDRAVAGWVRKKVEDWNRETIRTIQVKLQTTVTWPAKQSNSVKKTQNKATTPFKVIQGHRGRYQSKSYMRLPISGRRKSQYNNECVTANISQQVQSYIFLL